MIDCNFVKFSNGGQFFAAQEQNDICVFKFFSGERSYRFEWHKAAIVNIEWSADDTHFVSSDKNAHL